MNTQNDGAPPPDSPHLRVLAQYVKELSFQNALAATNGFEVQPAIDMGVEVKSRPINNGEATEVDLCINVQAKRGDQPMFVGKMGRRANNIAIRVDQRRYTTKEKSIP